YCIARGPPHGSADIQQGFGTGSRETVREITRQRIEIAQSQIERQRAMQGDVLRLDLGTRQPRDRDQQVVALRVRWRSSENMQAVADLHFLEIAQMRIKRAQGFV